MTLGNATQRHGINRRDVLRMGIAGSLLGAGTLVVGRQTAAVAEDRRAREACAQIEPTAGNWKTWVLSSGRQVFVPPPPGEAATQEELRTLEALAGQRDAAALDRIRFWDAGAAYRWARIMTDVLSTFGFGVNPATGQRIFGITLSRNIALVMVAVYEATISAWHWKYVYNRPRPSQIDPRLTTAVGTPNSPSYPSEHAAVAGAASTILTYLYPQSQMPTPLERAAEEGRSRQLAGVEYPSDVAAGFALGQAVGQMLIQRAKSDGAETPWTGSVPTVDPTGRGDPVWNGTNPIYPLAGTWKTWVLTSGNQFRPGLFPALSSSAGQAELSQVVNFDRRLNGPNFIRNAEAFNAQTVANVFGELEDVSQRLQEEHLAANPPRAARAYALLGVTRHDAMVAVFDAKYTYWRIRPFMAHPGLQTFFPTPNHPSYPAAHGAASGAAGDLAAYLFPRDAAYFTNNANLLAQSRLTAGIHYQSDIDVGLVLGRKVAQAVVARITDPLTGDNSNSAGAAAVGQGGCSAES